MDLSSLVTEFDHQNKKFELSCKQLLHLANQIICLNTKLERAEGVNHITFTDVLRLRLAALEGFRGQLHQYSTRLADQLDELECHIKRAEEIPLIDGQDVHSC